MSKKRRRSEVSEGSSGEFSSVSKRQCQQEWTVPRDLNTEVINGLHLEAAVLYECCLL